MKYLAAAAILALLLLLLRRREPVATAELEPAAPIDPYLWDMLEDCE